MKDIYTLTREQNVFLAKKLNSIDEEKINDVIEFISEKCLEGLTFPE